MAAEDAAARFRCGVPPPSRGAPLSPRHLLLLPPPAAAPSACCCSPPRRSAFCRRRLSSAKASGQIFTITDIRAEHSGDYSCEAQNMMGRHTSTVHLTVAAGTLTVIINIIRWTLLFVTPIFLLLFCLWMRRKKTLSSTTESDEPIELVELEPDPDYANASASDSVAAARSSTFE